MELNPNHKVTIAARGQWHKIAALILINQGLKEIHITDQDLAKITSGNVNIVLDAAGAAKNGVFTIRIVDDKTAAALARREGGRLCDN